MPRGLTDTFPDVMGKILQLIATGKMAVDADIGFLNQLEGSILQRLKASEPGLVSQQGGAGGLEAGLGASPSPIPVTPIEPLSRGPAPSPDMSGATAELERMLSGA